MRLAGEYYERMQKPCNIHYLVGTLLEYGDFRYAALGLHRPVDWAPLTEADAALGERLGRHLRRALQIHRQLTAVRHQNIRLYQMLDSLVAGVILVNASGKVRYANASADHLLGRHGALLHCPRNGLRAALPDQSHALQEMLRGAILTWQRETSRVTGGVIGLQRASGEAPLMLTITPLSGLAGYGDLSADGVAAAIFLTDPDARHSLSTKLLQESYGLSHRESEVCHVFVNQATIEGVAEQCGLSLGTVRSYIKAKHSQAELMRLLMELTVDFEHIFRSRSGLSESAEVDEAICRIGLDIKSVDYPPPKKNGNAPNLSQPQP